MNNVDKICGVANISNTYKNLILNDGDYLNKNIKEVIYATDFGEVEALIGFTDLKIIEIDDNSPEVHNARVFLRDDTFVQAIIFLEDGVLIVRDLIFFEACTRINGVEAPYTTPVETLTYEDEEALTLIEEDYRLQ